MNSELLGLRMAILRRFRGYPLSYKYPSFMNTIITLTSLSCGRGMRIYTHAFGYDFKLSCNGKFELKRLFHNENTQRVLKTSGKLVTVISSIYINLLDLLRKKLQEFADSNV